MIPVDALIFDLDGTLIDSQRDIAISVQAIQKQLKVPVSDDAQISSFIGDGVVKLMQRALGSSAPLPTPRSAPLVARAVQLFKAHYRQHCLDHTRIYPQVLETLAHFRNKKMAVVTNKPARISRYLLDRLGLAGYFPIVLGGDSLTRKKPHPQPIFQALDFLGVRDLRKVVTIGDSVNDIYAGRCAGTRTCGIVSNIGDPRLLRQSLPDFLILNSSELMRLFG